ncbi:rhodanese-like domain-containing protein [Spirosoma sp.]|uniref:rhodanese-like domain-containing protein n=1 Tax=Spirosoma sp. TaxID=1899569 RepID=UPI00261E1AA6|nr:rhodanese-like domain-containing protein [Spirosoma sp.]MCX6214213.1 rhodanese-like domain-containing protein [Spirosoma sp.]
MKLRLLLLLLLASASLSSYAQKASAKSANDQYVCLPCGSDCDHAVLDGPGSCPHCGMRLVLKKSVVFTNISPTELCKTVAARPNVILLDVRTPDEFSGRAHEHFGRLKNAINIPVQELESRLAELNGAKNKEIIVYCSHSHRSPRASHILTENGFTNVKNMTGGMSVWNDSVGQLPFGKALLVK